MYDVPDGQEVTNMWVSLTLVILGVSGIIISSLWKKKNPLEIEKEEDLSDGHDNRDEMGRSGIKGPSRRNSKDTRDDDYHGARSVDI